MVIPSSRQLLAVHETGRACFRCVMKRAVKLLSVLNLVESSWMSPKLMALNLQDDHHQAMRARVGAALDNQLSVSRGVALGWLEP